MMTTFYTNRRVAVVGAAGMIGHRLAQFLLDAGADVLGLDNFSRGQNRVDGVRYAAIDARQPGLCAKAYDAFNTDTVFNLAAAVAGVEYNQSHHLEMFWQNVALAHAPLQAAIECGVERYLQTSSVCIYSSANQNPAREPDGHTGEPTGANAGYSWAKRMGERLAMWAADEGLHAVIVRPTNVYGVGDYFDEKAHVIPAFIRKCLEHNEIIVNGSPTVTREFIWADDVARGMMAALEHGQPGRTYNLGTHGDTCISMGDLLQLVISATNTIHERIEWRDLFSGGDPARCTDSSRAHDELGWRHEVGLEDGIGRLVKWYRESLEPRESEVVGR